jgi:transposase
MNRLSLITISMHELDRVKIVEAVLGRRMKPGQAARRLQLTTRQIERLVKRYQAAGPVGLVSRRRGRPSNHELPADLHARVLR